MTEKLCIRCGGTGSRPNPQPPIMFQPVWMQTGSRKICRHCGGSGREPVRTGGGDQQGCSSMGTGGER